MRKAFREARWVLGSSGSILIDYFAQSQVVLIML
jgi:hypothetical protein